MIIREYYLLILGYLVDSIAASPPLLVTRQVPRGGGVIESPVIRESHFLYLVFF